MSTVENPTRHISKFWVVHVGFEKFYLNRFFLKLDLLNNFPTL